MDEIKQFYKALPAVARLLGESLPRLQHHFGEIRLHLELERDGEHVTLWAKIQTSAEDALDRLHGFDQEWWLDAMTPADGHLAFGLDYIGSERYDPEDNDQCRLTDGQQVGNEAAEAAFEDEERWSPIESAPKDGVEIMTRGDRGDNEGFRSVYNTRKNIWTSLDGKYGYDPIEWKMVPPAEPPKG